MFTCAHTHTHTVRSIKLMDIYISSRMLRQEDHDFKTGLSCNVPLRLHAKKLSQEKKEKERRKKRRKDRKIKPDKI